MILSSFGRKWLALPGANAAASVLGITLTSLGVSAFIQTLLDDADAATARTTLGAAGLTGSETIAGVKTFSSNPVVSGGGVSFPATQVPSASANTLDDYEEGTFTPTFVSTGATFSYGNQHGNYTKVGNLVYFAIRVVLNASGNTLTANALSIAGLPFTTRASTPSQYQYAMGWLNSSTAYVNMQAVITNGQTSLLVRGLTAASTSGFDTTANSNAALHATNGSVLMVQGAYLTD